MPIIVIRLAKYLLIVQLVFVASHSIAQVFKCPAENGVVVYQDRPCGSKSRIESSNPSVEHPATAPHASDVPSWERQIDALVRSALSRSISEARRLAVTEKHWRWIEEAEASERGARQQQAVGRTAADVRAERSETQACKDARRSYELESRTPESIAVKKQLMYEACGIEPPGETVVNINAPPPTTTVIYGNRSGAYPSRPTARRSDPEEREHGMTRLPAKRP